MFFFVTVFFIVTGILNNIFFNLSEEKQKEMVVNILVKNLNNLIIRRLKTISPTPGNEINLHIKNLSIYH